MKTKLFLSAAVMMALTAIASAQTTGQPAGQSGQSGAAGTAWIDTDNDGICDNFENGIRQGRRAYSAAGNQAAANRGPGRGEGLAQGMGNGQGFGKGVALGQGSKHTRGQGMMASGGAGSARGAATGRGLHNGQGPAFIDANKDGVCDNLQTTAEKK